MQSVEEFVYYDPVKKVKFSFDPITLEARLEEENVDWETATLNSDVVHLRDEIVKAMNAYLNRQFRKGTTEFGVYAAYDGTAITVEISSHNFNFKSYWGGEWLSSWRIDLAAATVQGSIKVHNHYFEQGNIQFNLNKEVPAGKLKALTARQVVDFIANQETLVRDSHLSLIVFSSPLVSRQPGGHVRRGLREATQGNAQDHAGDADEVRLGPPPPSVIE